ncbi:hypothetical protein [Magnetospirillum sp. UT-4]|uniref:hypothetical protein n=1 Tax=Magnetospirillum sp. UT-4 TaxID=2681467 RepID=UPI00137C5F84|nr:hypothetical protein [Magnetospirillum sp. UT-4]CAA7621886.1 conserved hypothetical protein [Magnetospirillum sp. UT-4]
MSISAAELPAYSDPDRLVPFLPSERADTARAERRGKDLSMFGDGDEPSFWDVLDVINPLQHIPIVSDIYQELTGDKIGVGARVAGGALFGGPIGLAGALIGVAVEAETGKDLGGHMLAMIRGEDDPSDAPVQTAAEKTPEPVKLAAAAAGTETNSAPVIAIPAATSQTGGARPAMFTIDGMVTSAGANAEPVKLASASPLLPPMPAPPAALAPPARFFAVPPRNPNLNPDNGPPPVSVPVSNSGNRSNVPITGRDPVAHGSASAIAAQEVSPTAPAKPGGNVDWLNAMAQALDKYERANGMVAKPVPAPTPLTVQ